MKVSSKAMSSPGRVEKFPPPLMRFLRSNAGSRSRGRSRSGPMFPRKKSRTSTAIETLEPSSPKVTCIGQVRVRRSKQGSGKAAKVGRKNTRGWCRWIRNALCCSRNHFPVRLKPKPKPKPKPRPFPPVWRKWWVSCFRGKSVIVEEAEDSSRIEESKLEGGDQEESEESQDDDVGNEEARVLYSSSSFSPPKNALLLTRCRSAPYRSSSLASRFWGSPLATPEEQQTGPESADAHNHPASESEPGRSDSAAESRTDPETDRDSKYLNQSEDFSACQRSTKPTTTEAFKTEPEIATPPLLLTRCKSEPARTGARLNPDTTQLFSRKTSPTVQVILPNKFLPRY